MPTRAPRQKKFVPVAIAAFIALIGLLALLIVDHGPWTRPVVQAPAAIPTNETAAAAEAAGATVTPTDAKPANEPVPPGPKPVNPDAPKAPQ